MTSITFGSIMAARRDIAGSAIETPLVSSPYLSSVVGKEVLLKLEITQPVGTFKIRGAANAIFNLSADVAGVTSCSTGNHGRGVAFAAAKRGLRAVICMSTLVPQSKVDGIKALGAEVRITGMPQDEAQEECLRLVGDEDLVEISPFDDPLVIAGQGTIGLELMEQRPDLATVLVPLSGGGPVGGQASQLEGPCSDDYFWAKFGYDHARRYHPRPCREVRRTYFEGRCLCSVSQRPTREGAFLFLFFAIKTKSFVVYRRPMCKRAPPHKALATRRWRRLFSRRRLTPVYHRSSPAL
jgi:hypothetical protein